MVNVRRLVRRRVEIEIALHRGSVRDVSARVLHKRAGLGRLAWDERKDLVHLRLGHLLRVPVHCVAHKHAAAEEQDVVNLQLTFTYGCIVRR